MKKSITRYPFSALVLAAACYSPLSWATQTSDFPTKTVNITVPYGAGGAADLLTRAVADQLSKYWEQSVIVENRPGAVGAIGIGHVIKMKPDGYHLVTTPVSDLAVNPHLYKSRPFSIDDDLTPVTQMGAVPNLLVVSSQLGVNDVNELVELAKTSDKKISYSSPGLGSQAHIAAEIFREKHELDLQHVPYNSVSNALVDVIGGHVDLMFVQLPTVQSYLEDESLNVLGVAARERSPLLPDLNTIQEITGEDYGDAISWSALMAPKDTPIEIRLQIAEAVAHVMESTELKQRLNNMGIEAIASTPEALQEAINRDSQYYKDIISTLKIELK